jgi:hypothetical protein
MALAYQEVFGTPVSELFPGLNDLASRDARKQMARLKAQLQKRVEVKKDENRIVQKFQWVSQRLLDMPRLITSLV